jgi:diguanylate cyclase (GGDEF)-like protein/PAS domain S-box-containing protein
MQTATDATDSSADSDAGTAGAPVRWSADGPLRMELEDIRALHQSEVRYRTIVDRAPIGIVLTDPDGLIIVANPAFQQMIGYSADELRARHFKEITHPDDGSKSLKRTQRMMSGHQSGYTLDQRYISKDGAVVWARVSISALVDPDGGSHGIIAMVENITERREIEEALRKSEARHREMFESNRTVQLLIEPDTMQIVDANPAACAFYGASRDDLRATTMHAINVLSADIVAAEVTRAQREERDYFIFRHRLWSGEERDVEVHSSPIEVDGRPLLYSIVHDITERKRVEAELIHQALHDSLTGLPNRILLHDRLKQAILRARRDVLPFALIVLDLDRFKEINDTFGHDVGDLLLQQIGPRLQEVLRQSDSLIRLVPATVARLGGDEFAIILHHVDEQGAITAAERLFDALRAPILVGKQRLTVGASMGIVLFPRHGKDAGGLLQRADVAMYLAKRRQDSYAVYDAEQDEYSPARHAIVGDLRDALETNGLHLHYQPEVTCLTGRTTRVEALARWLHPKRGMVPPVDFIPVAERTGLIEPLTTWVLQQALQQCARWHTAGRDVGVAVNLSAHSLSDPQLTETIERVVRAVGAEFHWLDVEITESAIMADAERSLLVLDGLHDLGVRISVDDFGTGYSSLTYLRRLPVQAVKIDRSFVVEMAVNPEDAIIVRSVIDLAHNLGLDVVAEGVEDSAAYDMLVSMGCEVVQGYYLSRPLPSDGIAEWLVTE